MKKLVISLYALYLILLIIKPYIDPIIGEI